MYRLSHGWELQAPPLSHAKPVLAVLFGSIFTDVEKQKEMMRLINEPYGPIGPDGPWVKIKWDKYRYFTAFGLKTRTNKDIYDNSGTLSDIYNIAAEAKAAGWKAVLLADELTWRQHTGTVSSIEDPERTATVVNIDCVDSKALLRPESTFFIRRLPIETAIGECVLPKAQKPLGYVVQRQQASFRETLRNGFYLRCPDEPIFGYSSDYNKPWMQSQALDRLTGKVRLPQELRDKIMSYVNEDKVRPLRTLINLDHAISLSQARKTFVQPLVPLTNEERQVIEAHPDFKDRFCNFYLGEWKDAFPASRRDVSRILRHFCDARDRIIFILRPPAEDGTVDSAVAYLSTDNASGPAYVVFRQYREHAHSNNPAGRHSPNDRVNAASQRRPGTEVFLDPEWTFPPGLPYWHKHTAVKNSSRRKRRRLHSNPSLTGVDMWLCFYLTSSLNEEERAAVESMVVGDNDHGHTNTYHDDYERGFSFIPWTKNVDGGREDMLRLYHMAYHADSTIGDCALVGAVAFIDRQSGQDNKVIVGAKWTDSQSFFKGLQLVRRDEYIVHALEPFQNIGTPMNWVFTDDVVDHIEDPDWIPVGGHLTRRDMRR